MLVHIQEAISQTNYCKQTILRLINTGSVQGYFNGNNSIVNIEQLKARKTTVKRGKKTYTDEQEQEVIKLFTTTKVSKQVSPKKLEFYLSDGWKLLNK